jgi:hypothetical protein
MSHETEIKPPCLHINPVYKKWALAQDDTSYYLSSAFFYKTVVDNAEFLNNLYTFFMANKTVSFATNQGDIMVAQLL